MMNWMHNKYIFNRFCFKDCALGGSAYVLGGVHLFSRLPLLPRNAITDRVRFHGFVNAGSLIHCPSRAFRSFRRCFWSNRLNSSIFLCLFFYYSEPKDIYHELLQKRKASYGLGVAVNLLGLARIEVNYCFPVTQRSAPWVSFSMQIKYLAVLQKQKLWFYFAVVGWILAGSFPSSFHDVITLRISLIQSIRVFQFVLQQNCKV